MLALVLTFDRLPAQFLSGYGNEWIETPNFDRLAAKSAVFEQHFAEIPSVAGPQHAWWTGGLEFFGARPAGPSPIAEMRAAGIHCQLLAEQLEGLPVEQFSDATAVEGTEGLDVEHDATPFARLISRAIEVLRQPASEQPQLLWLHSRGVPSPWLPPRFFAELYLNEFEPDDVEEPDDGVEEVIDEPPAANYQQIALDMLDQFAAEESLRQQVLSESLFEAVEPDDGSDSDDDSDASEPRESSAQQSDQSAADDESAEFLSRLSTLLFGSYVTLLDDRLGRLLTELATRPDPVLLIVTAAMGQSFGERTGLGSAQAESAPEAELSEPVLHTPLFVWQSQRPGCGTRYHELSQPPDVPATLQDWFGIAAAPSLAAPPLAGHSLLSLTNGSSTAWPRTQSLHLGTRGELGIRERGWFYRVDSTELDQPSAAESADADIVTGSLFVKPEDQWDISNVAALEHRDQQRLLDELLSHRRSPG